MIHAGLLLVTLVQEALGGVLREDVGMTHHLVLARIWKGQIKKASLIHKVIHSLANLVQEVLRVVVKECTKIGIQDGEDPQTNPHKEGALRSHLVFLTDGIAGDLLSTPVHHSEMSPGIPA